MAKEAAKELAVQFGVEVGNTLLQRLQSSIMGTGRAVRSTDVYIVNRLDEDLVLGYLRQPKENPSGSGIWTSSLLPPYIIRAGTVEGFGCESHGFMTGVTEATTRYMGADSGQLYTFTTNNPFYGSNSARATPSYRVRVIVGGGNNNVVRFVVNW